MRVPTPAQGGDRQKEPAWVYSLGISLAIVAAPLGVALLLSLATDFGRTVDMKFFELWAQVMPVLALPLFLERGGILAGRIEKDGLTSKLEHSPLVI